MPRLLARTRLPMMYLGIATVAVSVVLILAGRRIDPLLWTGMALFLLAVVLTFVSPAAKRAPLAVASPVTGRWLAVNSPATNVPSHGSHAYGQSHAVDLVHDPGERPAFGGAPFRRPDAYPGFGQPIRSASSGVVATAVSGMRDHRGRSSIPGLAWMFLESLPRELCGTRGVLGNHLVVRLDDGTHMVYAHLRRGSLRVRRGDAVSAGEVIAECGNSGNTSEPHLHVQRQDIASVILALGLPWTIEPGGIPPNGEALHGIG